MYIPILPPLRFVGSRSRGDPRKNRIAGPIPQSPSVLAYVAQVAVEKPRFPRESG